ncbi:MAG: hypothetical protein J6M63_04965 [Pseudobutyrivibrio sp.]|uniref:hypothetical protein n=1 Tax=Pseudobutyrivibrio sp. TaxID=2014367 RepID=UPI001B0A8679|nr:hypothetical protein [Pseudobutyrivibrio sp.]MBO5617334.1 hypothetical protein [Pseudobutyrivibrio sp.]MBO6283263.1 hypothetical protein [Pseudobutyrivibrio sp.]MBP3261463.1 hypothetical protein [Pseudobutyrivibrio sp.]
MDWIIINVFVIFFGIALLIGLPMYFKKKNIIEAAKREYEANLKEMVQLDKQYAPYISQLNKNLNIINHWLKTGKDPTESEEESEKVEKEDKFFAGLMSPLEAKKWKEAIKKAKEEDNIDFDIKSLRVNEFDINDMNPCDVKQTKMKFNYSDDFGENIYYCINPDAITKHLYRHLIFFTTARTTNIPLVYPYKYEGAQMLSLYKHPAQTVWFLQNWKLIREGLESADVDIPELDESVTDEFDL